MGQKNTEDGPVWQTILRFLCSAHLQPKGFRRKVIPLRVVFVFSNRSGRSNTV